MMKALLLKNGTVLHPDGRLVREDVLLDEGKIRDIGQIALRPPMDVLDVKGRLILPGMIDPHVHFREPGFMAKEGIENGSRAAIKGGVTTVFDMPNTDPPCDTPEAFEAKERLFKEKSRVHWGLHYMATPNMRDIPERAVSAKIFMARSSSRSAWNREEALLSIFRKARRVTIHAEDETCFTQETRHHLRRPREAIRKALETIRRALILLPESERPRVVICHVSTLEDVQWLADMKARGFDVWGETAPHYLWFTRKEEEHFGARYRVNPPLREVADRDAVRQALRDGIVDFIGTDHAPHTPAEKRSDHPPSGIPGIEWAVPAILELAEQKELPWSRITRLISSGAADCYGLSGYHGIQAESTADLVILKKDGDPGPVITRAGYNPYKHIPLTYTVDTVFIEGKVVYSKKKFFTPHKEKELFGAFTG
jgi:dihydroorotase